MHRGVYINHTGSPSRVQREWAAVLLLWPAALTGRSALPIRTRLQPIHVVVDVSRTPKRIKGVVVRRTTGSDARVTWVASPPRVRIEHAAIDVASTRHRDPVGMFRTLADVVPDPSHDGGARSVECSARVVRVPGRTLMVDLLEDLATGACSVLEREYLRIERRPRLPEGDGRTGRRRRKSAYRDVDYEEFGVLVELHGRAFHDDALSWDVDALRDLDTLVDERPADGPLDLRTGVRRAVPDRWPRWAYFWAAAGGPARSVAARTARPAS